MQVRFATAFSIFLFTASALIFFFKPPHINDWMIRNAPPTGTNIVAFGDSLVEGYGSSAGGGFVKIVSDELGIPIENLGRSGDTTEAALKRLPKVLKEEPDVTLVLLGGNDYLRRIPREKTFSNLATIIDSLQQVGSVVVVLGVRGGFVRDNYEDDYRALAEEHGALYVSNVLEGLIGNRDVMYDGIHPNDIGYEMIAERVYPVVKDVLK